MPRFRLSRRRLTALALLPFATFMLATSAGPSEPTLAKASASGARINTSKGIVRIGDRVILRGAFPGASRGRVQVQRRAPGAKRWRNAVRTRTGPRGRYRVRLAPRRSWRWRALLLSGRARQADEAEHSSSFDPEAAEPEVRRAGTASVRVRSRARVRVGRRHLAAGGATRIGGRVRPAGRRTIAIRAAGRTVRTRTRANGRFAVRLGIPRTGSYRIRVQAGGNRRALGSRARAGRVTAYRAVGASYYGPGFYGGRTACGQTLTTRTIGTAHRTLPCGTKLRLRHRGRTLTVRVIDRGPFVGGRELDLTYATKRRLGFGSTGTVLMSR